jgi:predicted phosphodiesterase
MKIAVFADVHGNLPALELFLAAVRDVDLTINLGDTVNYGPWSNECAELLFTLKNNINILGNHDEAFIKGTYNGTNDIAVTFFEHCIGGFHSQQYLLEYSDKIFLNNTCFIHTINGEYIYADSTVNVKYQTALGHSHRQFIIGSNGFKVVNPGSVGQNRIDISIINYSIWDTDTNEFELCSIPYDATPVINEMKSRKYPQKCIDYYLSKQKNGR